MQYPGCLAILPFSMFWFGRGHGLQNILVSLLKCRSLGPRPDLHWIRTATVPRNLSFHPAFPGDSHPGHSLRTTIGTFVLVDWSKLITYQELYSDSLLMVKSVYFTKIKWIIKKKDKRIQSMFNFIWKSFIRGEKHKGKFQEEEVREMMYNFRNKNRMSSPWDF